jgi:hypothetical protein
MEGRENSMLVAAVMQLARENISHEYVRDGIVENVAR